MEVTTAMYLTVCPLIFLASLVDAIGGGGGLISLPAYYLAGLPPTLAAGTNKLSACFGTLVPRCASARAIACFCGRRCWAWRGRCRGRFSARNCSRP